MDISDTILGFPTDNNNNVITPVLLQSKRSLVFWNIFSLLPCCLGKFSGRGVGDLVPELRVRLGRFFINISKQKLWEVYIVLGIFFSVSICEDSSIKVGLNISDVSISGLVTTISSWIFGSHWKVMLNSQILQGSLERTL